MEKIIIDTDIGSDIDDAIAIALAINCHELDILGITTVYGDTDLRAKLVKKMLEVKGDETTKVYAGIELPLMRKRPVWMAGHEGDGVISDFEALKYESIHAVDFIIDAVMSNPNEVTLIPIGPLTNIAAAIIKEPKIIENVKQIVMMGGITRLGSNRLQLEERFTEHNITSDPEAAAVVFESGAKIKMVGLDVTTQVRIDKTHRDLLQNSNIELNKLIVKMLDRWFDFIPENFTLMHDPLTVALLVDPSFCKTTKMDIILDYSQIHPSGQTIGIVNENSNIEVCLEVDSQRFIEFLFSKLMNKEL